VRHPPTFPLDPARLEPGCSLGLLRALEGIFSHSLNSLARPRGTPIKVRSRIMHINGDLEVWLEAYNMVGYIPTHYRK
jgi:hypothetical protein